jgi:hypothetical protein
MPDPTPKPVWLASRQQWAVIDPADWPVFNRRRGELIDREVAGTITPDEAVELARLQADADLYLEATTPRPTAVPEGLEARVLKKQRGLT